MRRGQLLKSGFHFYRRYYHLIFLSVVVAASVISGSLLVGDSVRSTLTRRVQERLLGYQSVISSGEGFLGEEILGERLLEGARGVLQVEGFIPGGGGGLLPVTVWGVDDVPLGKAKVNKALDGQLDDAAGIVLRLPSLGMVPSGSLLVTDNYTCSLSLDRAGVVGVREGGNLSLKGEQTIPLNIFVSRRELQQALEVPGKINMILSEERLDEKSLRTLWNWRYSGLIYQDGLVLSDRTFVDPDVVAYFQEHDASVRRIFSYFVNEIRSGEKDPLSYCFVTAVDSFMGREVKEDELILSAYSAERLGVQTGAQAQVSWFVSKDFKLLGQDSCRLQVSHVYAMEDFMGDASLKADYPGLTDAGSCSAWESDLPIDMRKVTGEDERYWDDYRNLPKALVSYKRLADSWSNPYGSATALGTSHKELLDGLTPDMLGVILVHPWDGALENAASGVDFSALFLALGSFILLGAILLMAVPEEEMIRRRQPEILLLQSLGFTKRRIIRGFFQELLPLVLIGPLSGVLLGVVCTFVMLFLLGNVWKGATNTEGFTTSVTWSSLLVGYLGTCLVSALALGYVIRRNLKDAAKIEKRPYSLSRSRLWTYGLTLCCAALMLVCFLFLDSLASFLVSGILVEGASIMVLRYQIIRHGQREHALCLTGYVLKSLYHELRSVMMSFALVSLGVFTVFSVGLNRQDFTHYKSGPATGGYDLLVETSVPVYHQIRVDEGEVLQMLQYEKDDASCLNLNRVTTPTVLGVDMKQFLASEFVVDSPLQVTGDAIAVLADRETLLWSLMKQVGDTLYFDDARGIRRALVLAGSIRSSILQGYLVMEREDFYSLWPEIRGSKKMLVKSHDAQRDRHLLSQSLYDYGARVRTVAERLMELMEVTDTYLSMFLTLGFLGLVLGVISLVIVTRKSLLGQKDEIRLLHQMGFTPKRIMELLTFRLLYPGLGAVLCGFLSAVIGVGTALWNVSLKVWLLALVFLSILLALLWTYTRKTVQAFLRQVL